MEGRCEGKLARRRGTTGAAPALMALSACLMAAGLRAADEPSEPPPTLARRLCASYAQVQTLSCRIRKVTRMGERSVRMLSSVHYQRPDHIHVDNTAPSPRRIIADGQRLFYHETGARLGFSKPVGELRDDWLIMLRTVPGSPMEYLLRLRDLREEALEGTETFPVRRGYQAEKRFIVLNCDTEGRLARIDFYESAEMRKRTGSCEYDAFQQVAPGCWIPCLHKETVLELDEPVTTTRRISNLVVNQPVAPGLFDPKAFFKDVEFTGDFHKTYQP
ncbi:MAG: hypothetical protein JXR37_25245 [Kiritimatiellae bacterium]|nr:hypothetical protein [Kiritimatiellia bacterium]